MRIIITFLSVLCLISCTTDDAIIDDVIQESVPVIFEGDVTLGSQQEIEDFGAMGYTEVTGIFRINPSLDEAITSLIPLNTLTTLNVVFIGGTALEDFEGLESLTSIEGTLNLISNNNLTSISQLGGVTSSILGINLENNISLINLIGLENIEIQSDGLLRLSGNSSLESAMSLENGMPEHLRAISIRPFTVFLSGEPAFTIPTPLTDLSFLNNVTSINTIYLDGFQGTSLQGLHNLISCNDGFGIIESPFIEDMSGLENLQHVNNFGIGFNSSLTSLDGLDNLTSATGDFFSVFQHSQLNDFCSLEGLFTNGTYAANNYNVTDNLYNPTIEDIMSGNCSN